MSDIHIIPDSYKIDALRRINYIASGLLVLFVVDDERRMVGTLTDGDVGRALIRGIHLEQSVREEMRFIETSIICVKVSTALSRIFSIYR